MLNSPVVKLMLPALWETIYMVLVSSICAVLVGLVLGIVLYITDEDGIMTNKAVNKILGGIVNIGRSIPFIIIVIAILPFTRMIVGTSIGSNATIVPLTIAAIPFVARVIENSLKELDKGVIEAAMSFGASNFEIIFKVLLPETAPSIVHGITLTIISIFGYSAMAGAVGGGGLGNVAIQYGYIRFKPDILYIAIIIMIALVQLIQLVGTTIGNKLDKR